MFGNKTMKATNSSKSDNKINSENTPTSRLSLLELFFVVTLFTGLPLTKMKIQVHQQKRTT
jgi:hypothetical protein